MNDEPGVASPKGAGAPGLFVRVGDGRLALLCAVLALLVGLSVWEPVAAGVWHDDGAYLLLARSLAGGEGLAHAGVPGSPPGAKFPPLYPVLLALAWLVAPGATAAGAGGGLLNVVLLALGAGAAWLVARLGFGLTARVAPLVLLPWASPDLWRLGMVSLSEPLFVLLLLASVGFAARLLREPGESAGGGPEVRRLALALGVALGLLCLTRTIGVVVAASTVAALLAARRMRPAAGVAAVVAVMFVPWMLWSSARAAALPEPLRELMGPYGRWLAAQYLADPSAALSRAVSTTPLLATIGGSLFLPGTFGAPALIAGALLGAGVVWATLRSGPTGRLLLLTLGGWGVVLWLWPHTERRLVAPVLPLLALGVALLGREATRVPDRARSSLGVAVGLWAAAFVVLGTVGLARDRHLESYRIRETMLARSVAAIEEAVPAGGVVGAPEFWGAVHLLTGRPVAPSARFQPLAAQSGGTPEEQFALWEVTGIEYVLLEQGGRVHREALDTLDARCPGAVRLLASWEGGLLVRLEWDVACRESLGL